MPKINIACQYPHSIPQIPNSPEHGIIRLKSLSGCNWILAGYHAYQYPHCHISGLSHSSLHAEGKLVFVLGFLFKSVKRSSLPILKKVSISTLIEVVSCLYLEEPEEEAEEENATY